MGLMGIREFAGSDAIRARYGRAVAPSTITRMGQDGKLIMQGGKIDVEASLKRMDELGLGKIRSDVADRHAKDAQNQAQAGQGIPTQGQAPQTPKNAAFDVNQSANQSATHDATSATAETQAGKEAETDPGIDSSQSKTRYKAIALHYENQTIKLGMGLNRGLRYYRADVRDEAHSLANAVRAGVERLIDQTAPRLAVIPGHADRGYLLRREVRKLVRMLNREYPNALRRLRKSARKGKEA